MAILKVNPTRITLINLKKQVVTAKRWHKLLKDKRDGLMKQFMAIIKEVRWLRKEVEAEMWKVFKSYLQAASIMDEKTIQWTLWFPEWELKLSVSTKNIMSVHVPEFSYKTLKKLINYWFAHTSWDLDLALSKLEVLLPKLLKLAELEKKSESLADEIETTRRRVNALEYTMIPNIIDTIKFITMKLWEQERATIITTMIVKGMIEEQEEAAAAAAAE